jgi:hypothetical protein
MPAELNLSELRPWLDEHERYARSIAPNDPRSGIAVQMLAVIAAARADLAPSADSTANYVPNKEIIAELGVLRDQAEHLGNAAQNRRDS